MNNKCIERAKLFIEKNLEQPLTLETVAREAGMSKYHFTRTFKNITGRTLKTYINEVRIEKAKSLMNHKPAKIIDVLFETGYNDPSYFSRVFRKFEGICPSNYKKQCQYLKNA